MALILDLTAFQVGGISDGAALNTWPDQSASANDATIDSVAPIYRATGGPNSNPTIQFNGSTQGLLLGTGITSQPITIYAVVRISDNNPRTIVGGSAAGCLQYRFFNKQSNALKQGIANIGSGNTTFDSTKWVCVAMTYDGTTAKFFQAGAADGSVTSAQTFTTNINRIGKGTSEFWSDYISAIKIYDSVIADATVMSDLTALESTWGISTSVRETLLSGEALQQHDVTAGMRSTLLSGEALQQHDVVANMRDTMIVGMVLRSVAEGRPFNFGFIIP